MSLCHGSSCNAILTRATPCMRIWNSILELPMKSAIYGTLTGLLNAKNAETGGTIVKMASDLLQESLAKYQWRNAKLLLRFFGELVNSNVILPTTLLQVMEQLLVVLEEPTVLRVRRAFYDRLKYFLAVKRVIDYIIMIFCLRHIRLVRIPLFSVSSLLCHGAPLTFTTATLTTLKRFWEGSKTTWQPERREMASKDSKSQRFSRIVSAPTSRRRYAHRCI